MARTGGRRRSGLVAALLAVAAVALAGCGGDNGQVTPTRTATMTVSAGGPSTSDAPAAQSDPTQVADDQVSDPAPAPAAPAATTAGRAPVGGELVGVDPRSFYTDGANGMAYYFQSPSGNVKCGIGFAYPSIKPGCQAISSVASNTGTVCKNRGNSTYGVTLFADHAGGHCMNQPAYVGNSQNVGAGTLGGKVLEYGEFIATAGVICRSTTAGITCTPDSGRFGFVLARDRNDQF